jgi:hypothetical protein
MLAAPLHNGVPEEKFVRFLTPAQKERFEDEGYLVVENFWDVQRDIAPVMAEYEGVLDGIAKRLHAEGAIKSTYSNLRFSDRMVQICIESGRMFGQDFDFSLPHAGITPETPIHTGPAVFRMLTHPKLLDMVEDIVGPEIYSNPVQHVRMKLPQRAIPKGSKSYLSTRVPWHQDNGVIMPDADDATILTVWYPLSEATIKNGCLRVMPRSHRAGIMQHCPTDDGIGIPDQLVTEEKAVPLPMKPGSVLLMTQRTMHGSLDNTSEDDVRISMDLRYQPIGQSCGRPAFAPAGFVARSRSNPESELRDATEWTKKWHAVRQSLVGDDRQFYRWHKGVNGCA